MLVEARVKVEAKLDARIQAQVAAGNLSHAKIQAQVVAGTLSHARDLAKVVGTRNFDCGFIASPSTALTIANATLCYQPSAMALTLS